MLNFKVGIVSIGILVFSFLMFQNCSVEMSEDNKLAWTFLFYDDADFTEGYDPLVSLKKNMWSGENLNVLVLRDIHSTNAKWYNGLVSKSDDDFTAGIYYLDNQKNIKLLKELGEVNMGDPKTLKDFIIYAKTVFPADRYAISFYDHGGGYLGACSDTTNQDWLYMSEMREAIQSAGGVNLVMFSAPCLMGALESMNELRDVTQVYVGSENTSGYMFWHDTMKDIRNLLNNKSDIDIYQLGREIVWSIDKWTWALRFRYPDHGEEAAKQITMSAVRTDKLKDLVPLFEDICSYYLNHQTQFNTFMDQNYGKIETYYDWNMDLVSLIKNLLLFETDRIMITKLQSFIASVDEVVLAECHGENFPDSHGIAVYHPKKTVRTFNALTYGDLMFADETSWDTLVSNYFSSSKVRQTRFNPIKFFNYNRELLPTLKPFNEGEKNER